MALPLDPEHHTHHGCGGPRHRRRHHHHPLWAPLGPPESDANLSIHQRGVLQASLRPRVHPGTHHHRRGGPMPRPLVERHVRAPAEAAPAPRRSPSRSPGRQLDLHLLNTSTNGSVPGRSEAGLSNSNLYLHAVAGAGTEDEDAPAESRAPSSCSPSRCHSAPCFSSECADCGHLEHHQQSTAAAAAEREAAATAQRQAAKARQLRRFQADVQRRLQAHARSTRLALESMTTAASARHESLMLATGQQPICAAAEPGCVAVSGGRGCAAHATTHPTTAVAPCAPCSGSGSVSPQRLPSAKSAAIVSPPHRQQAAGGDSDDEGDAAYGLSGPEALASHAQHVANTTAQARSSLLTYRGRPHANRVRSPVPAVGSSAAGPGLLPPRTAVLVTTPSPAWQQTASASSRGTAAAVAASALAASAHPQPVDAHMHAHRLEQQYAQSLQQLELEREKQRLAKAEYALCRRLYMEKERQTARHNAERLQHEQRMRHLRLDKERQRLTAETRMHTLERQMARSDKVGGADSTGEPHWFDQVDMTTDASSGVATAKADAGGDDDSDPFPVPRAPLQASAAQHQREVERFVAALKSTLRERCQTRGLELPPLCPCAPSFWEADPKTCATNCAFRNNPAAFSRALDALVNEYGLV